MHDFVEEMNFLKANGVSVDGKHYEIDICCFVCDAPCRVFLKNIRPHNAHNGCERFVQKGKHDRRVTFPKINAQRRTNVMFDELQDTDHHKGTSALQDPGIGMVSQFVLDYMHLVCLCDDYCGCG